MKPLRDVRQAEIRDHEEDPRYGRDGKRRRRFLLVRRQEDKPVTPRVAAILARVDASRTEADAVKLGVAPAPDGALARDVEEVLRGKGRTAGDLAKLLDWKLPLVEVVLAAMAGAGRVRLGRLKDNRHSRTWAEMSGPS